MSGTWCGLFIIFCPKAAHKHQVFCAASFQVNTLCVNSLVISLLGAAHHSKNFKIYSWIEHTARRRKHCLTTVKNTLSQRKSAFPKVQNKKLNTDGIKVHARDTNSDVKLGKAFIFIARVIRIDNLIQCKSTYFSCRVYFWNNFFVIW